MKKILIIRNDHIGDLVLSTAVFREIKKFIPDSKVTLIINKTNRSIVDKNPYIDEIIELNMANYSLKSIRQYLKIAMRLKGKFDVGVDLRGGIMNSLFLLWLTGIEKRISRIDHHPIIKYLLTNPIKINKKTHATEDNLKIINNGLGINSSDKTLEIVVDKEDEKYVNKFIKENKLKNYVCICPITGLIEKQWPLKNWMEIIKNFDKKYKLILLGTKGEENILEELCKLNKNCKYFINFDVRKLLLLFKNSKLVLTQDGGPMHIAWASEAKLIELHNLFLYGMNKVTPLNNSKIIYTKCIDMNSISVEEVEKEVKKALK
ncbi:MAG: glycosyltransferase family 9 protein [Nanoarchaeota archaeon]